MHKNTARLISIALLSELIEAKFIKTAQVAPAKTYRESATRAGFGLMMPKGLP
ncbi:hypothetical protein PQH03_20105 [Ralstonia insidiosa]|uniref:hypothetical protein n=1 Tax=Ralstonia TaxID=48736 RepID=UPI001364BA32|nr:hypothetical protein [Ralstonia insidiosa]MBX3771465.1 hypothetical protein [Ralstonia pickettii]NOZ17452.1 hypothetical protein [Betaproteobacteria bacterium]MBC9966504.1 hypothetical protein [Ralstonia insidiosa]MBX3810024.1 hypothetical protein [Ralstonia pickettii]MBX3816113.1 hypothetical protein [Ralstonia insidiosa]